VKVRVTGGDGFLGRHTRVRLRADTNHDVVVANRECCACYPIPLVQRADHRGSLVEVVRNDGGQGQTFVSITKPGATPADLGW
jgi:UDP-glucose 4-epimerase